MKKRETALVCGMLDVAIIGAGVSGLAAAIELEDCRVSVFEKSRGYGGRAATRRVGGIDIDHGANYLTLGDGMLESWFAEKLPSLSMVRIEEPIWVFDQSGSVVPGDSERDSEPKLTFPEGIYRLGQAMAEACSHSIFLETRVASISRTSGIWTLLDEDGAELAISRRVIISVPIAQAVELLPENVVGRLGQVPGYYRQFSVMLVFDRSLEVEGDFYAALNRDKKHPIAWFSREDCKPGRVPGGHSAWVVQLSPKWTAINFEMDRDDVAKFAIRSLEALLNRTLPEPIDSSVQRWKFAHPKAAVQSDALSELQNEGLHFCGDGLVGKGRLGKSILSGLELGRHLKKHSF